MYNDGQKVDGIITFTAALKIMMPEHISDRIMCFVCHNTNYTKR